MSAHFHVIIDESGDIGRLYKAKTTPHMFVIDGEGVVRDHHLGPVSSTHLWASLAEIRQPGSVPGDCSAS